MFGNATGLILFANAIVQCSLRNCVVACLDKNVWRMYYIKLNLLIKIT